MLPISLVTHLADESISTVHTMLMKLKTEKNMSRSLIFVYFLHEIDYTVISSW